MIVEMFIQSINKESKSVRFGNVLGSQPNRDNIRELVFNRERPGTNEEELNVEEEIASSRE